MLVIEVRGKPEYPEENLSEQGREPTTNSTHVTPAPFKRYRVIPTDCESHTQRYQVYRFWLETHAFSHYFLSFSLSFFFLFSHAIQTKKLGIYALVSDQLPHNNHRGLTFLGSCLKEVQVSTKYLKRIIYLDGNRSTNYFVFTGQDHKKK